MEEAPDQKPRRQKSDHLRMVKGEITVEEYVERVRADVDERFNLHQNRPVAQPTHQTVGSRILKLLHLKNKRER
jgi:broad specificity phosphatase PhoE